MINQDLIKKYSQYYNYDIKKVEYEIDNLIESLSKFGYDKDYVAKLIENGL